jgi:hypothetical protein
MVVNIQGEYTSSDAWNLWLPEPRRAMPQPWPEKVIGRIASDGSEHFGSFRFVGLLFHRGD